MRFKPMNAETNTDVGAWGDKPAQLKALGLNPDSASLICAKMNRAGGWRLRSDLAATIENARMSLSAASLYYDQKNWNMMLLELSDGVFALEEVKKALNYGQNKA